MRERDSRTDVLQSSGGVVARASHGGRDFGDKERRHNYRVTGLSALLINYQVQEDGGDPPRRENFKTTLTSSRMSWRMWQPRSATSTSRCNFSSSSELSTLSSTSISLT